MVVAEVPLWVIHSSNTNNPGGTSAGDVGDANNDDDGPVKSSNSNELLGTVAAASESLSLLVQSGGRKKCAIYSIDVHISGTKFATAGGDGTVRLWSTSTLFPRSSSYFDQENGTYVSSSSDEGSRSSSEEDDNVSKHSNGKDDDSKSSLDDAPDVEVHDLNAVVRRKKGGAVASNTKGLTAPTSPSRKDNKQPTTIRNSSAKSPRHNDSRLHKGQHRLLCTLSAHTGSSVLCVRFSTSGQYLASAGDDACVCIYAPSSSSHYAGNLVDHKNYENWTRIKLCRGHQLDVLDLAWAPDDSHLVSCSIDSTTPIIVWKLNDLSNYSNNNSNYDRICNPYRILGQSIHTSTVKGVTFDPAGSYLASSGDDPAVCIWRAHDDWGLEARIDANTGIFRQWNGTDGRPEQSNQSLFRRISWATDGTFICSTNSVVKNKYVASTISREGWAVSGGKTNQSGAANLVGHRQPVVVSRHSPHLLDGRKRRKKTKENDDANGSESENSSDASSSGVDDDEELEDRNDDEIPSYGTLLALGDRRGFVTVWSTRKSRPIFKLQCSVSRCSVTDLSWGSLANGDLMLLASFLDGQVAALRFSVPNELGHLLSSKDKAKVFQMRYGIDLEDEDDAGGKRRMFVGENSGPRLIENALQMTLEEDQNAVSGSKLPDDSNKIVDKTQNVNVLVPRSVKDQQEESVAHGKKRVRPVLMQIDSTDDSIKRQKASTEQVKTTTSTTPSDLMQNALNVAEKVTAAAENTQTTSTKTSSPSKERTTQDGSADSASKNKAASPTRTLLRNASGGGILAPIIPHSTNRVQSVDLILPEGYVHEHTTGISDSSKPLFVAECTNSTKVPTGSKGSSIPCIDVALNTSSSVSWRDQIIGTSCSALAASRDILAVGTSDGIIQLYGTSPAIGWASGLSFRSHPPLVLGQPIVSLQLQESKTTNDDDDDTSCLKMLVLLADGEFKVYTILPGISLQFKGSVIPAMTHMALNISQGDDARYPKFSRFYFTEKERLLLLLSTDTLSDDRNNNTTLPLDGGVGGSLQAFVYDRAAELWLRISDSRFVLSDFYSALPAGDISSKGDLSTVDDMVRMGSVHCSLKASNRTRLHDRHQDGMYNQAADNLGNFLASRSHCEDRMACALALGSASDFKHWLAMYARALATRGQLSLLRLLIDMLVGGSKPLSNEGIAWWLSHAPTVLNLNRSSLIKQLIIPEMSKNRNLQRFTNEVAMEIDNLE